MKMRNRHTSTSTVALAHDTLNFKLAVQPIFEKNCSPCHFPGGKMYDRLPFDKSHTVVDHHTMILKRLKKKEDISLIRQYLQQRNVGL